MVTFGRSGLLGNQNRREVENHGCVLRILQVHSKVAGRSKVIMVRTPAWQAGSCSSPNSGYKCLFAPQASDLISMPQFLFCVCMCVEAGDGSTLVVFSEGCLSRIGGRSSLSGNSPICLGWPAREPQEPLVPTSPALGLQLCTSIPGLILLLQSLSYLPRPCLSVLFCKIILLGYHEFE